MYADKNVAPRDRGHQRRRVPAFRFPEIRFGVRLFGSSNGRAFRATTPDLMNPRIRLRSEVAATLRSLSAQSSTTTTQYGASGNR
jgi:hypothetical protein